MISRNSQKTSFVMPKTGMFPKSVSCNDHIGIGDNRTQPDELIARGWTKNLQNGSRVHDIYLNM